MLWSCSPCTNLAFSQLDTFHFTGGFCFNFTTHLIASTPKGMLSELQYSSIKILLQETPQQSAPFIALSDCWQIPVSLRLPSTLLASLPPNQTLQV